MTSLPLQVRWKMWWWLPAIGYYGYRGNQRPVTMVTMLTYIHLILAYELNSIYYA